MAKTKNKKIITVSPTQSNLYENVVSKLKNYENMTWQEIFSAAGGRSIGSNNHFEDVSDLSREAQKRLIELHMLKNRQ